MYFSVVLHFSRVLHFFYVYFIPHNLPCYCGTRGLQSLAIGNTRSSIFFSKYIFINCHQALPRICDRNCGTQIKKKRERREERERERERKQKEWLVKGTSMIDGTFIMKSRVRSWQKIKAYAFSPELYDIRIYYSYRRVWKSNRLLKYKALGHKRAWNGNVMAMINFASLPLSFVANGPGLEFHRYRDKGRLASWLRRCALLKYFHVIYIICGIRDSLTRPCSTRRIRNVQALPLFALLFYKLPRWSYREIPQWADFPVIRVAALEPGRTCGTRFDLRRILWEKYVSCVCDSADVGF